MSDQICIRARGLLYRYDPDIPALNGIDLDIADNAFLAVVGQNGSGKTTLVKHFNGLLRPDDGQVWVYGTDTATVSVGQLARTVGYVFQNPDHQIFCATVRDEIAFGPRNLGLPPDEIGARVDEALSAFDLREVADHPPALLGFGQRRLVSVAAVYAMRPRVLILDEPTIGLDWRSARELLDRVSLLHRQGHTIILISHDMRLVAEYTREMLVMLNGRVLAHGPTREVFAQEDVLRQAQLMPPQVTQLARRLAPLGVRPDALTVNEFCEDYVSLRGSGR